MINIKVISKSSNKLDPVEMLDNKYSHSIFQQYCNDLPENCFYINCGINEESLIAIWYSDEDEKYNLSTDDRKSLRSLLSHVKVVKIDAEVNLTIKF